MAAALGAGVAECLSGTTPRAARRLHLFDARGGVARAALRLAGASPAPRAALAAAAAAASRLAAGGAALLVVYDEAGGEDAETAARLLATAGAPVAVLRGGLAGALRAAARAADADARALLDALRGDAIGRGGGWSSHGDDCSDTSSDGSGEEEAAEGWGGDAAWSDGGRSVATPRPRRQPAEGASTKQTSGTGGELVGSTGVGGISAGGVGRRGPCIGSPGRAALFSRTARFDPTPARQARPPLTIGDDSRAAVVPRRSLATTAASFPRSPRILATAAVG